MVAIYAAGAALRGTGGIYSSVRVYWFRVGSVLILAGSSGGLLILRHAGGNHIERVRVALGHGDFTALQADSSAGLVLLAGILLLIPGFITDFLAVLLLDQGLDHLLAGGQVIADQHLADPLAVRMHGQVIDDAGWCGKRARGLPRAGALGHVDRHATS